MKRVVVFLSSMLMMFLFLGWTSTSSFDSQQGKRKPWNAPDKFKTTKNPVKSDAASIAAGKALFSKHCKSCHGSLGKGDGPKARELDTPSGDFTEKDFIAQADGELFYKIKEGREDMPSFKKKISDDEEIWQLVNYVRTLGEKK